MPGEQWKRPPDLSVEVKNTVSNIMPKGAQGAMDMALLAALAAIFSSYGGAAIEACSIGWRMV
jgi:hypothetical protein